MGVIRKNKRQQAESSRVKRLGSDRDSLVRPLFERRSLLNFAIYLLFTVAVILVCFTGLDPLGPSLQRNQIARVHVISEISFEYASDIQTRERMEAQRQRVPPVYRLDPSAMQSYQSYLTQLFNDLIAYAEVPEDAPEDAVRMETDEVSHFLDTYDAGNPYNFRSSDLASFYNRLGPTRAKEAIQEALIILGEITDQGIHDPSASFIDETAESMSLFHVLDEAGNIRQVEILSEEDALRSLRINLLALDIPRDTALILFRLLRTGIRPNLEFDEGKTEELIQRAQAAVQPVRVQVQAGDTIVEANSQVTAAVYEQLEAYRAALRDAEERELGRIDAVWMERFILTLAIIFGAALYLRTSRIRIQANHRVFILSGGFILANLVAARLILELGGNRVVEMIPMLQQLLPWMIPVALGPIILTVLVGAGPAVIAAGLISVFNAMMQGNSLSVLIASLLSALVGIYCSRNIQLRARVVRAGVLAGVLLAVAAMLSGIRDNLEPSTVFGQTLTAILAGLFTGMIVVALLPLLENLFNDTTDITLLELTDFNHPLLRKMQVEAPGSYHHSLMVANLSENAAASIGANSLLCRVCALFHDIGKMVKPEYFAENQRSGYNPHIERNPSMSALVIKSHVKEGVQLARKFKLPQVIEDVIRQHHGTSLIQYFYYKALEKQKGEGAQEAIHPNAPRIELDKVDEDTYRYEGPVPQFTESAIIMLADSLEAASRSLRKVTPQSIEELVDGIVTARMEDGQLDDTPLTFSQLKLVKESFMFTLLNMLHARVEYPEEAQGSEKKARKKMTRHSRFSSPGLPLPESITEPPKPMNPPAESDDKER
ncbi:MAG: HDIG domain-containing protein [Opitutales bacterium]|nr:HDIG domain-containing protein [Opitutales bacterium]